MAGRSPCPRRLVLLVAGILALCAVSGVADTEVGASDPLADDLARPTSLSPIVAEALPPPREAFTVGIAELSTSDTSAEARVAAVTFPRLLYENLSRIDSRDLTTEELVAYARRRREQALEEAATRLQAAVEARDRLLFDREVTENRVSASTQAVDEARSLVEALRDTDLAAVPADDARPLRFWDGHAEGRLVGAPGGAERGDAAVPAVQTGGLSSSSAEAPAHGHGRRELRRTAREQELDLLIFGVVETLPSRDTDYLAVDIYAYHRFMDTVTSIGGTISLPEELGLEAPVVAREAASALLGRSFASLVVRAAADAAITVDGELVGYGEASVPYLRPGTHELVAQAAGYEPVRREVELEAGDERKEVLELATRTVRTLRLRSSPGGADVYADSVWVGTTPLEVELPPEPTVIRVHRPGYLESRFVVDRETPDAVTRALLPDSINWSNELRTARDDFYQSLTWFVLSVPVTMLLNGGYEAVRGAFPPEGSEALDPADAASLGRLGNLLYWSSMGSLMVNVGLFANLIITIFDYVAVGEGPHNQ